MALARRPLLVGWRRSGGGQAAAVAVREMEAFAACLSEALTQVPMGESAAASSAIAGFLTRTLAFVVGPFIEKWGSESGAAVEPAVFEADLEAVLAFLRDTATEMAATYSFPDLVGGRPPGLEAAWWRESPA